ncbi:helix-turn-helix domain-containing protein [Streptomyces sp. NPDC048650]|uniref:helix-turn-helix domain-containing protein n=1 Tax=unclassified Streptomyces TaxID=2593676 RepID=UPI00371357CF
MTDLDQLTQSLARNLKHWRTERGYTLDALAARAGVSRGMIIQIEQARTNPSVGTTVKIADALGVSITTLLDYEQGPQVRIVSPGEAVRMWSTDAGSHTTLLVGAEAPGPFEMWDWRLMPGDHSASDPHPPGTVELIHVRAGRLTLIVDGEEYKVDTGASVSFEAKASHGYRNDGTDPVEMTMSVIIPLGR